MPASTFLLQFQETVSDLTILSGIEEGTTTKTGAREESDQDCTSMLAATETFTKSSEEADQDRFIHHYSVLRA